MDKVLYASTLVKARVVEDSQGRVFGELWCAKCKAWETISGEPFKDAASAILDLKELENLVAGVLLDTFVPSTSVMM